MAAEKFSLAQEIALFFELYSPKIVEEVNELHFRRGQRRQRIVPVLEGDADPGL